MKTTFAQPKVIVSAQIDREQRAELERRAAEADRTISWLVRDAVASYLDDSPSVSGRQRRVSETTPAVGV